ncbi:hypothetical protein J5N97_028564 [Dioscorea zingiberensis]|uniref:Subtilisin-like protease SBT1.7 n=1 Tax=Dioscorea zingiberensis TaxID=325984 RepID=A0A9D5BYP1_9LILI|nr:hypothetical protein J5N97_028564 [Dioscorea zingiberensis]
MPPFKLLLLLLLLSLLFLVSHVSSSTKDKNNKLTYIIHMAKSHMPSIFSDHHHWYQSSLSSISSSPILYTYDTVAHGFSAPLTAGEANSLRSLPGVLSVLPETHYTLHTTRTPHFLGLNFNQSWFPSDSKPYASGDVIIGVLDTGVWPESPSFNDEGFSPVPARWRGACETAATFNTSACNRKLIGARFFAKGYETTMGRRVDETRESRSPRDDDGHGTHTATTVAGSPVSSANLLGYATGTARGMATHARLAVYKVCWAGGCFSSDILAAMDRAVADGCHVLSISIGGGTSPYYLDNMAIGAFSAMENGVFVSCSAGNSGPVASSLTNVAPWITTVGAGTLDRNFPASVTLGNGVNLTGVSLYQGKPLPSSPLPLVYAGKVSNDSDGNLCLPGTLDPSLVAGKLVLCDRGGNPRVEKGYVVKTAGGAGMVLGNTEENGEELLADAHLLPAAAVGEKARDSILSYVTSNPNPTATIVFLGTKVGIRPSPVVASFSSRGPNTVTPEILKPDIIAPGVNILAGWTRSVGPTGLAVDRREVEFNIISGTSMSCPHVSGLAALLKGAHPEWSPAAIKSSLMTTAYVSYPNGGGGGGILDTATSSPATPFDYGSGHVDLPRAMDPGLVYDLRGEDYVDFLCALDYTTEEIASLVKKPGFKCDSKRRYAVSALNYPSFAVAFETESWSGGGGVVGTTSMVTHMRTLTNVGPAGTYKVKVTSSKEVRVKVEPEVLVFKKKGDRVSYQVIFTAGSQPSGSAGFGRLEWTDGKHVVASPIAYTWT